MKDSSLENLAMTRIGIFTMLLGLVVLAGCSRSTQSIACGCHIDAGEEAEELSMLPVVGVATEGAGLTSANGSYFVIYSVSPDPLPLNEPFSINVRVLDGATKSIAQTGIDLDVDGRMPHHRHGMNRVPRVTSLGNGEFRVDGMLFHMPGRWELYFDVKRDGRAERAMDVVMLD